MPPKRKTINGGETSRQDDGEKYEKSDSGSDEEGSDESEDGPPPVKKAKATPNKVAKEAQVLATATYLICMHDFCWQAYLGKASLCGATRFCM
jgi:hypothetical protein